jgi:hypothetical protein
MGLLVRDWLCAEGAVMRCNWSERVQIVSRPQNSFLSRAVGSVQRSPEQSLLPTHQQVYRLKPHSVSRAY